MGSFVAASIYLCFTLLHGRRIEKEGVEEEGKKETSTDDKEGRGIGSEEVEVKEEEKRKDIGVTISDTLNTTAQEVGVANVGGEGTRGTWNYYGIISYSNIPFKWNQQ